MDIQKHTPPNWDLQLRGFLFLFFPLSYPTLLCAECGRGRYMEEPFIFIFLPLTNVGIRRRAATPITALLTTPTTDTPRQNRSGSAFVLVMAL
ncbi:hypothetical protein M434DRAFT_232148 [Hypoxylon sp. CO27-5]|nr:hypothetical protein M434DRAFT_232148 [Hypoxylon sp. CO27-5]